MLAVLVCATWTPPSAEAAVGMATRLIECSMYLLFALALLPLTLLEV